MLLCCSSPRNAAGRAAKNNVMHSSKYTDVKRENALGAALEQPFDPRKVKDACREAMNNSITTSGLFLGSNPSPLSDLINPDHRSGKETSWWKNQIRSQLGHAKAEAHERELRRHLAVTMGEAEQARRIQEEKNNAIEEAEERKRRREYAKSVIREEQWTRIREVDEAIHRDEAERRRRRCNAVKALVAEESRLHLIRLKRRDLRSSQDVKALHEEQSRQALRRRNRALFQAGIRLHMQYFRAVEQDRLRTAGNELIIKRSKIEQAVRDIYLRDCLDTTIETESNRKTEEGKPPRSNSTREPDGTKKCKPLISRKVMDAQATVFETQASATTFFKPLPSPSYIAQLLEGINLS